jgi:hypothetical protein
MEVAEDLLEEGKALLSDAVERDRGDVPGGWRNDSHVHGTPIDRPCPSLKISGNFTVRQEIIKIWARPVPFLRRGSPAMGKFGPGA